jgi:hypothetical protein
MKILGYSVNFFLENSLIILDSLLSDESALALLKDFKYETTTLEEGLSMQKRTQELETAQIKYHATMQTLSLEFYDLLKIAKTTFRDYMSIVIVEFKKDMDQKLKELVVDVFSEGKQIEWLKKAKECYTYVINSKKIMDRISQKYNFTLEKMQAALKTVTDAEKAKSQYNVAKGNAEDSITQRNKILNDLSFWMKKLLTVSEVAFKPNPQYMEKCNIRVLSEGYKRKKKETPAPVPTPTPAPA